MPYNSAWSQYFDASALPATTPSYVVWLDVMGVQATLSRSLMIAANFVGKLHSAVLEAPHALVDLYPVMDGVFASTDDQAALFGFLTGAFERLAATFVHTVDNRHRFLVKAAIAYGPVIHGRSIPAAASQVLAANARYRDSVLLGMPMVQAFRGESRAAPFRVFVDESARAFSPTGSHPIPQPNGESDFHVQRFMSGSGGLYGRVFLDGRAPHDRGHYAPAGSGHMRSARGLPAYAGAPAADVGPPERPGCRGGSQFSLNPSRKELDE